MVTNRQKSELVDKIISEGKNNVSNVLLR